MSSASAMAPIASSISAFGTVRARFSLDMTAACGFLDGVTGHYEAGIEFPSIRLKPAAVLVTLSHELGDE
jgi:hypothetical protein